MLAGVADAIAGGRTDARDILAAVTPGGGKSLLPVLAAARLVAAGIVDRVCWVVPRDSLRLQAEEAFADPAWRATLGHALSFRAADNAPDPCRGLAGYVTTYQGVAAAPDLHLREFRRHRFLLVVDEVHHLPALADVDPDAAAQAEVLQAQTGAPDVAGAWSQALLPLLGVRGRAPAAVRHAGTRGRPWHPVAALSAPVPGSAPARWTSTRRAGRWWAIRARQALAGAGRAAGDVRRAGRRGELA